MLIFKSGFDGVNSSSIDRAGSTVDRDFVTLVHDGAGVSHLEQPLLIVYPDAFAADHRWQTQSARHYRRMTACAYATGQDAFGYKHAVYIIRAGFLAYQNDALSS